MMGKIMPNMWSYKEFKIMPFGATRTLLGWCSILLLNTVGISICRQPEPYYGRLIGPLNEYAHGIKGTVYAVDESTVFIKNFAYDGTGPDAFFWAGVAHRPSPEGFIVPYPEDNGGRDPQILGKFTNQDVLLKLPAGKKLREIKWISVWCRRFTVNFGDVFIPQNLEPPRARVLPEFKRLAHGLRSGNISVLDAKTFYIPNLHYDGAGPDAYFWVGNGSEPNSYGVKVPNEIGSLEPLHGYQGADIEIQLPGKMTVYDIEWLAVWCVKYAHNFGHVYIPKDLDVPPALGQTKITTSTSTQKVPGQISDNCRELLDKRLQVRWEIQGNDIQITLTSRLPENQYMSFGISGMDGRPSMIGSDVVVAFWDTRNDSPRVVDYFISHLAQCDGYKGVCPDDRIGGRNDLTLVSANRTNGIVSITYKRPLTANDLQLDRSISTSKPVSVIAAFGPLNSRFEANAHAPDDKTTKDEQIDFSTTDDNTCIGLADLDANGPKPWPKRIIYGTTNFTVRIGPAGGKRGYTPLTGHPSWGIAFWVNDQLIPELYVERGKTYTFIVEGGDDRTNPAKYHPLYISDSSEGGFGQKIESEQRKQRVFAGVTYDTEGYPYPTAAGHYCEWVHKTIDQAENSETFEDYVKTLQLECVPGEPAILNWTVAHETPDVVYYQCYTHNNLGWKIKVLDPGAKIPDLIGNEIRSAASIMHPCLIMVFMLAKLIAMAAAR